MSTSIYAFILFFEVFLCTEIKPDSKNRLSMIDSFLNDSEPKTKLLQAILESGLIDGNFSTKQAFEIFDHVGSKFPKIIQQKIIGKSIQNRNIYSYFLSKDNGRIKRSKSLIAAAYHARELTTVNAIVGAFLELVHSMIYPSKQHFLQFCDVIFVPVVNIDSHTIITETYNTPDASKWSNRRKNMNKNYCTLT